MTIWDHIVCAFTHIHHDLLKTPPLWAAHDLDVFLHWMIPSLMFLHIILGIVNARQARNPLQRAMTRFLFAKAGFWGVLWLSFHVHNTVMWFSLDAIVVLIVAITATDLLIRLTNRYVFVHSGNEPPAHL